MFTRSAKRIPTSFSEGNSNDNYNKDATTKTDIKTRHRRMKENMTEDYVLPGHKKRVNYVSYPSDDESIVNEKCADVILDTDKKAHKKKSSKIILKEVNPNFPDSGDIVERRVTRLTRQNKNKYEGNEEETALLESVKKSKESKKTDADIESVITNNNVEKNSKKTKRNKKASNGSLYEVLTAEIEHVTENNKKAKKKKKGKISNSSNGINTAEGEKSSSKSEKSSASIDSFHSAAGSPVTDMVDEIGNMDNFNVSKSKVIDILNKTDDQEKTGKRRKSSIKNDINDTISSIRSMNTHDVSKSKDINKSIVIVDEKSFRRVKSSIKTDINDALSPIGSKDTLDVAKSKDTDKSNISNDYGKSSKRRKSSIVNVVQDAHAPISKDVTLDKCSNDSIVLKPNTSYNAIDIVCTQSNTVSNISQEVDKSNVSVNDHESTKKQVKTRKSSIKNNSINMLSPKHKIEPFDKSNNSSDVTEKTISQPMREDIFSTRKNTAAKQRYSASVSNCFSEDTRAFENASNKKTHQSNTEIVQDKKYSKLDVTFEKSDEKTSTKSSLISSDDTLNVTYDKSDTSRISITSDESRTEHIVNTTPMLIESSLEASDLQNTPKKASLSKEPQPATTPLKREGTFIKDGPGIISPKTKQNPETPNKKSSETPKKSLDRTPTHRMSMGTPGSTPFPFSKSSQKESVLLNVTRSIEKQTRRSSLASTIPRTTRVMFCSPLDNPVPNTEAKRKIVKSSLKGSNKSFVFDDSISAARATPARLGRKRSYTQDESQSTKRTRIGGDAHVSAQRLSRSRTLSASGKLSSTPAHPAATPSKLSRTRLPNFAAVHQRRFNKMESLDECQQRKARRAQQLLAAIGTSPRVVWDGEYEPELVREPPPSKRDRKYAGRPEARKTKRKAIEAGFSSVDSSNPQPGSSVSFKNPAAESAKKPVRESSASRSELKTKPKADTLPKQEVKPKAFAPAALPSLEAMGKGYTRFGFRMNIEINPFNNPGDDKKEKPLAVVRKTVPSHSRAPVKKETAQQIIMGQKPSLSKRSETKRIENRMHIKGVRTNRRFELQMKMRGVEG